MFSLIPSKIMMGATLALLASLGCYMLYHEFSMSKAEKKLSECRRERQVLRAEQFLMDSRVKELTDAVAEQSLAMRNLTNASDARQALAREAEDMVHSIKKDLAVATAALQATQGASCSEGIDLIDKDLSL